MPSGVVMYLMPRSTATAMLLLPSSTEGMYALLMAPRAAPWLATVKYTIPDKNTRTSSNESLWFKICHDLMFDFLTVSGVSLCVTYWIQCCCGRSRSPEPWYAPLLPGSRGRSLPAGWTSGYGCSPVAAAGEPILRDTHDYTLFFFL